MTNLGRINSTILAVALLGPTCADAQSTSALNLETHFWETLKRKDLPVLRSMMSDDYFSVEDQARGREEVLKFLSNCRLTKFSISSVRESRIGPDTLGITYRIVEDIDCLNRHQDGTYVATTVWTRHDGRWVARLHTEHPLTDDDVVLGLSESRKQDGIVRDQTTAIAIAKIIGSRVMHDDLKRQEPWHAELRDGIWEVFGRWDPNPNHCGGGGIEMEISKRTGEVLHLQYSR